MKILKRAPDFTLPDQYGRDFKLSENLGRKILIVFYPKDDSPVCTKQLCDYNNNLESFLKQDMELIGISTDSIESHKEFSDKYSLKFRILSDKDKKVSRIYEALNIFGINKRKVILINENGMIEYESSVLPLFFQKTEKILEKSCS